MACESTETMAAFKKAFLTRFEGTDKGEVTTYLGCELIRDRVAHTIVFRQAVYAKKILQLYGAWDKNPVKNNLQPGTRLSQEDSPEIADPVLHCRYRCITGHLSFLVTMTRCYLAFSYAKLSKFVQLPGPVHLAAAEHVLQYLRGTFEEGLVYSDPGEARRKMLGGLGGFRLRFGSGYPQICDGLRTQPQ
eukprot:3740727-Rhodomonas_salina.2